MSKIYEQLCVMHKQKKNTGPSGKKAYYRWIASLFIVNHTGITKNITSAMVKFDEYASKSKKSCTSITAITDIIIQMIQDQVLNLPCADESKTAQRMKTPELLESIEVYVYKEYYFAIKFSDDWRFQIGLMSHHVLFDAPVKLLNHLLPRAHKLSASSPQPFIAPLGVCEWFIGFVPNDECEDYIITSRQAVIKCCQVIIDDIIAL